LLLGCWTKIAHNGAWHLWLIPRWWCSAAYSMDSYTAFGAQQSQAGQLALQKCFKEKRNYVLKRLENMGLKVEVPPSATFYIWLDLSCLPEPLNGGLTFFEELLKERSLWSQVPSSTSILHIDATYLIRPAISLFTCLSDPLYLSLSADWMAFNACSTKPELTLRKKETCTVEWVRL